MLPGIRTFVIFKDRVIIIAVVDDENENNKKLQVKTNYFKFRHSRETTKKMRGNDENHNKNKMNFKKNFLSKTQIFIFAHKIHASNDFSLSLFIG